MRLKDIELLTGLGLLPDIEYSERTQILTHLQVGLLERLGWGQDDECPLMSETEANCPPGYVDTSDAILYLQLLF